MAQDNPAGQGPLRLTTARWVNRKRRVRDVTGALTERWSKVLAHKGSYEQFRYGTDTKSAWQGPHQIATICSCWSLVIAVDVDDEPAFMTTRTARHVSRKDAISTRGGGFHILIDARSVPPGQWPRQGPIAGGDVKSNGFIPMPGSMHWSGEKYEPVLSEDGKVTIVTATPDLITAIRADLEDARGVGHGGHGGHGGGHDGEIAATVLGNVLRGLAKEECYREWQEVAVPRDPGDPFGRSDFDRHYSGAVRKAAAIRTDEQRAFTAWQGWISGGAR